MFNRRDPDKLTKGINFSQTRPEKNVSRFHYGPNSTTKLVEDACRNLECVGVGTVEWIGIIRSIRHPRNLDGSKIA